MRKDKKFIILTCILLLITTSLVTATVKAEDKKTEKIEVHYLVKLEKEYRKELKAVLKEAGYSNTGITMTKIVDKNTISYAIKMNHKRFKEMSVNKKNDLQKNIKTIRMGNVEADYSHDFL